MTDEKQFDENDEQLDRLLKPLDDDAAAVDSAVIADVVRAASAAFAAAATGEGSTTGTPARGNEVKVTGKSARPAEQQAVRDTKKAGPMFAFAKPIAVLVASVVMLAIAMLLPENRAVGEVTFGAVLDQALKADTLKLKAVRDGAEAEVLVVAGQRVRWQDSPQQYRIASGTRLWRIDESANTVRAESNPWVRGAQPKVDLLALLGVSAESSSEFRSIRSSGRVEHAGFECDAFEFETKVDGRLLFIRAYAKAKTHELYSIGCWPNTDAIRTEPPIAELQLVAHNVPYDESKFEFGGSLSEDGRIGKVVDRQGIVLLRPMTSSRWTPVAGPILVKPGDWIRTDVRGANAVAIELTSGFKAIPGPGSLLELTLPGELKLHRGEVRIAGSKAAEGSLKLRGLNEQAATIGAGETKHYRIGRDESMAVVAKKPIWLTGFEGSSSNESIGSLIANIDGRDVPLTVGFHRVKVEIRDQIARTTIEESFVNRTNGRLEGIFHFPLPQDASISGFGMWIGGELIEADVVEKQRAREIYETILRERRDPGLLEWTGGNIFKARVFPIEPHSEKRIRIVYTQVLPLRANKYRYSYGLRSELLQKTPLRELSLEVLVNSAIPLKSIDCPTHEVRTQSTRNSARLEFTAQEYTPTRDFEVVCEVDSTQSDVVVIPHQRGEDGYFLAQLTPPSAQGNWQRQVLPDGEPLNVLLVCDTSGSMDSRNRELQEQFVAAVLSSLSPADRFNIATCDVDCQWKFAETQSPSEELTQEARDWLAQRRSLGWTDLDRMSKSVLQQLGADTKSKSHIIYIGDGIVTAGDADAQAFAARLKRMTQVLNTGTFHAVSVGSSFESGVLKSIAAVGGGSVRQIDGEQTPGRTANELLNEIAQPGLRNLQVEFKGLQVAAVYPETLPNLSAGTQQIIIGRYLPQGEDQTGEIIVTGERNGETVRFASRITLRDAERSNSFIPRLWARAHLDHLLQQGRSDFIKDDIIALSEEFHIMTPYTSLLVLETDEDRERFGVKRRFLMRDGERFFADGRNSATFELLQQQMKAAGEWRLGLRRRILSELSRLGRDLQVLQQLPQLIAQASQQNQPISGGVGGNYWFGETGGYGGMDLGGGGGGGGGFGGGSFGGGSFGKTSYASPAGEISRGLEELSDPQSLLGDRREFDVDGEFEGEAKKEDWSDSDRQLMFSDGNVAMDESIVFDGRMNQQPMRSRRLVADRIGFRSARVIARQQPAGYSTGGIFSPAGQSYYSPSGEYINPQQYVGWVNQLFPTAPPVPAERMIPATTWPADAVAISQSLVQTIAVKSGGLRLQFDHDGFDPRWNRPTTKSRQTKYYSPQRWLTFSQSVGSETIVDWCAGETRGAYSRAFHLGQRRKSVARDLSNFKVNTAPYAVTPLHHSFPDHKVEIQRPADGRIVLVLTPKDPKSRQQFTITIDSTRNVVLETEWQQDGKVTSKSSYGDYVQLAGGWWPRSVEVRNGDNQMTSTTKLTLQELNDQAFATQFDQQLPKDNLDQLLSLPAPSVKEAKVAAAGGKAKFEHHLVLLLNESLIQNWDEVLKHLERLQQLANGKPGMDWIRLSVLLAAQQNEDARQVGIRLVNRIVQQTPPDELFVAGHVLSQLDSTVDRNEKLSLLDQLQPLFDRQPPHAHADRQWKQKRATALNQLNRKPEALVLQQQLAESAPWDVWAQTNYARAHKSVGDFDKATGWLRQRLDDKRYNEYERQQFRQTYIEFLREDNRVEDLVRFLAEWVEEGPETQTPYDQYLSAIFDANRKTEADDLAKAWIEAARQQDKLEPVPLAKLNAAVGYALADRYRYYMYRMDPEWLKPMEETALYFFGHEHHFDVASRIMNHHRFNDSDERERLDAEAAKRLKTSAAKLDVQIISSYVAWAMRSSTLDKTEWLEIATVLRTRWDAENDLPERDSLAGSLISIYSRHSRDELHLPFMRQRIVREKSADPADAKRVAAFVTALFNELLSRDWQDAIESEAIALLPRLSAGESKAQQLAVQVAAQHRFVDRMFESRFQASMKKFQAEDSPEELTRTKYREQLTAFRKTAREGLAQRLADFAAQLPVEPQAGEQPPGRLADWINVERMHLDVVLNRRLPKVTREAWTILGQAPVPPQADVDAADANKQNIERRLFAEIREVLQQRALVIVSNLAARRSAPDGLVDRVLKYIDAGIAFGGDAADAWKSRRLAMLVALDRPEQIERDLRSWIPDDEYPAPWQLTLGRIVAEQGKIDEAIRLFEAVKRDEKTLPTSDNAVLAKWYLVQGRKDDYRNARVDIFMATEEWQINNWINQQRQPWYRSNVPLPTELDENVLFAFQALFQKSNQPGQYAYQLRDFYTACRDFRLLQVIPDSVVGRTPQQVYHFLTALRSSVLAELRNEATADEIMKRLVEVRKKAASPIDKRACDLLEAMIERRSSNVLNQPGPHIDAAVAALQRAFEHDWADGEVQQMAAFLDAMGQIKHRQLNAERLRQLRTLHKMTEPGTDARLLVAWSLAHAQYFSHGARATGVATIEIAVREFLQANPDGWPARVNAPFAGYIDLLKREQQFARAENVVQQQLQNPVNPAQELWLRRQLNDVFVRAFDRNGQVSLGQGGELYQNLWKYLLLESERSDDNYQSQVFNSLNSFFRSADKKPVQTSKADLRTYAFQQFPKRLRPTSDNYQNEVSGVKSTVRDILGAKATLEFLMDRMENYPLRLEYSYQSAWQQYGYELAKYRYEARGTIGELEPRLLEIVLTELRRDLTTRQQRNRNIFHTGNTHHWSEKAGDFLRVAEEVLAEHSDSGRSVMHISNFIYNDLNKFNRAIEVMLIAHGKGLLNPSNQIGLCQWLHDRNRHAESIPILEPLVKDHPDVMQYRTMLITAYGHSNRKDQMRTLLAQTDKHFRKPGLWTESNMAQLGSVCFHNSLYSECVGYYDEAIDLHQRTQPNRGIGNGTLSSYYTEQGRAWAGLGNSIKAVDAAAAGVIAWGPYQSQRSNSLYWLERVINQSRDLDAYVKYLDKQAAENGTDSPLIRKMVGKVYAEKKQHQKAIAQLQISIELQPNDTEAQELLIKAYEDSDNPSGAVRQMLAMLDFDRHNLDLYKRLADKLKDDEVESERAATSIIESAPSEASHHQALAEFREKQERWSEAIPHWQHVARLRALEPTGLINLAEAQVHEKQWEQAQSTLDKLNRTEWPSRFSNVTNQVRQLQSQIPKQ